MRGTLSRSSLALFAITLSAASGCASPSTPFKPDNPYPTRAEVASIEAEEPPAAVEIAASGLVVDRWTLQGPLPETIGATPRAPQTPLETLTAASTGGAQMTEQLRCVAREIGLFQLANGELPARHVERFIVARCGATSSYVWTSTMTWKKGSPDAVADYARLVADGSDDLAKMASGMGSAVKHAQIGAWMSEGPEAVVAFFVVGRSSVELEPTSILPGDDGEVVLRGSVYDGGYAVGGLITRGERGAESCTTNTAVEMPRFEISCPIDPTDASARFELSLMRKPTSVTTSRVLSQMVWPARAPVMEYVSPTGIQIISGMDVKSRAGESSFPPEFTAMANVLREAAGLPAFAYSPGQSASQKKLTPHIISALSGDEARSEQIILAASAGWAVEEGKIVDSHVSVSFTSTTDPRQLMGELVDSPSGRRLLYSEGEGALALGVLAASGRSAMLLSTYQFLPDASHKDRLKTVQRTINRARKLAGKPKMKRYKNFYVIADRLASKVESGELNPQEAADFLVDDVMSTLNRGVRYHMNLTGSLDDFIVPESFLLVDKLHAAIMVAPYKPEGFPHTMYFITVVYPDLAADASAARSSDPSTPAAHPAAPAAPAAPALTRQAVLR